MLAEEEMIEERLAVRTRAIHPRSLTLGGSVPGVAMTFLRIGAGDQIHAFGQIRLVFHRFPRRSSGLRAHCATISVHNGSTTPVLAVSSKRRRSSVSMSTCASVAMP